MVSKAYFWIAAVGLLSLCAHGAASAATSANFQASAEIQAGCSVDSLGSSGDAGSIGVLDFGQDMALSTATHAASLSASQTIVLRCTPGVALTFAIDGGRHAAAGVRNLQLGGGTADRLQYRLYADAGFSQEIGVGQGQSIAVTSGNMNDVRLPIFGRLVLPGSSLAGVYTDVLVVTLDW